MGLFCSCLKKAPAKMVGEDTPNPITARDFKTEYEVQVREHALDRLTQCS